MALDGIDKTMIKSGTVVVNNDIMCHPLKNMNFSVSPVVQYSIKPKKSSDIAKFCDTLKKFVKSDPCLQYIYNKDASEHILAGAGELHLDVALEQLRTDFLKGVEFVVSEPIVPYCETVTELSSMTCLAKSSNKHNRLYMTAEPIQEELVREMESGELPRDSKEKARYLIDEYGICDAKRIWTFAPEFDPRNFLVNESGGVQYLNDVQHSISAGIINNCDKGPLCEEPVRGVRFNLKDAKLHQDNVHRGDNQILPMVRNIVYSTMLTAKPRLMEPVFKAEITVPRERVSAIYGVMSKRRGNVDLVVPEANGITMNVEATMPVAESFGFIEDLRSETSGTAFASLAFSHWQLVPGDPLEEGSYANKIMLEIRKRKGKKVEVPKTEDYFDKL